MFSILLSLFVISLMITLGGFLLTTRNRQPHGPQRTSAYVRGATTTLRQGTIPTRGTPTTLRQGTIPTRGTPTTLRQGTIPARTTRLHRPIAAYEEESHVNMTSWTSMLPLLDVRSIFTATGTRKQTPWLGILFLLSMFFAVGLYSVHSLLPGDSFGVSPAWMTNSASAQSAAPTVAAVAPVNTEYDKLVASVSGASKALQRVSQLDPAQYASTQEFNTWAYSACSAAAMTEVINSYGGHNYRVTDILNVESRIGEITSAEGLLEPTGIDHTVRQFNFKTVAIPDKSLDNLISIANNGRPVIVSFPPDRWDGGHILVLRGGDADNVYLADSSRLNMTVMKRAKFLSYWEGYAILAVPQNA